MKVLVACEFSGVVRQAFRDKGHDAWSCDMIPAKDKSPYHILGNAASIADSRWDMMIAHPPCTHLATSGARWFREKQKEQLQALDFVRKLMDAPIPKICIENPVGIIGSAIRPADQVIQPWQFGDSYQKATCLWLKGLGLLWPTKIVDTGEIVVHGGKKIPKWISNNERNKSITFAGIARAMAEQWG
jgi:hypothetical protein